MARLLSAETVGAVGMGAAEAAIGTRMGPGGIPASVFLEGAGLAVGFFGGAVGVPAELRDGILYGSLALAGKRATSAAMNGRLMQGPKAWGGDGDSYPALVATGGGEGGGGRSFAAAPRLLGRGGGFSLYPISQEAPGVAG